MGNFNRDSRSGGDRGPRDFGKKFGNKSFGGREGGGKPAFMYDATCAKCGKACQVPFKPSAGRPVYCRDCFTKPVSGGFNQPQPLTSNYERPRAPSHSGHTGGNSEQFKDQFAALNAKLDAILRALNGAPAADVEKTAKVATDEVKEPKKAKTKTALAKKPTVKKKK